MGSPIIMGRKTQESLGCALPGRKNIVITRQEKYQAYDDVLVARSLEDAILLAQREKTDKAFIIGGAQIYAEALEKKLVDEMYLTRIFANFNGDTFFPAFPKEEWRVVSEEPIWERTREWIDIQLCFQVLQKIK